MIKLIIDIDRLVREHAEAEGNLQDFKRRQERRTGQREEREASNERDKFKAENNSDKNG